MSTIDRYTGGSGEVGTTDPDRFANPGLPPHHPRRGDVDPRASKTSERIVLALFGISTLGTIGFLVAYFALPTGRDAATIQRSTMSLGLGLAFALLGIGTAAIQWSKSIMNNHERVEERHPMASSAAVREAAVANLRAGAADSGISRRGLLKSAMIGSLALFPLTIIVPLIGDVGGTWDVASFKHTMWKKGLRLTIDPSGRPIRAADVSIGSVTHVIPDGLDKTADPLNEKAKAIVLLVRLDPRDLHEAPDRVGWSHEGIVAYSKICTHVGCPVALYEQQTHHLLCPCHQSTFDVANGAKVVFGPAKRPLPQLPITVDTEGYLVAQSDFHEPVGPSFWERLR
ncbi:MAG: Rieske 2Fe-2S domain-containing protein [Propionibacterium sp.]|nr:Rieske 2Fe-2S domain-containing protein [Propionibacterium sp.]